jgi:hypothetical protein
LVIPGCASMASLHRFKWSSPSTDIPDHLWVRTQHQLAMSAIE